MTSAGQKYQVTTLTAYIWGGCVYIKLDFPLLPTNMKVRQMTEDMILPQLGNINSNKTAGPDSVCQAVVEHPANLFAGLISR